MSALFTKSNTQINRRFLDLLGRGQHIDWSVTVPGHLTTMVDRFEQCIGHAISHRVDAVVGSGVRVDAQGDNCTLQAVDGPVFKALTCIYSLVEGDSKTEESKR